MIHCIFSYKGPQLMGIIQANQPENKYSNVTVYLVWQLYPHCSVRPYRCSQTAQDTWTSRDRTKADWKLGSLETRTTGRQRCEQAYVLQDGGEQETTLNSIALFAEDVHFLTKREDN